MLAVLSVSIMILSGLIRGTVYYEHCIETDFYIAEYGDACGDSKAMYDMGKALCSFQGREFQGDSSCGNVRYDVEGHPDLAFKHRDHGDTGLKQ